LDNFWNSPGSLDVGAGERLYDWRIHSYSARHRNRCGVDQDHSGAKTYISDLNIQIKEGEANTKGVRTRKDFFRVWRGCENNKIMKEVY
jgi:hypothetical protein